MGATFSDRLSVIPTAPRFLADGHNVEEHQAELVQTVLRDERIRDLTLVIVRQPGERQPPCTIDLASGVITRFASNARREFLGAFLHDRVVHHRERLDRRDRVRSPGGHDRRVGAVERFEHGVIARPCPESIDRATVRGLGELAGRVGEGVIVAEIDLHIAITRAANLAIQRPGHGERGIAKRLAFQATPIRSPQKLIVGVDGLGRLVASPETPGGRWRK